jgi:selT/selW/selH-like putative selenoprotein
VAEVLLSNYQHVVEELSLITSSGGAFEVRVDDQLIFSKKTVEKRHAEPGEILERFAQLVGPDVTTFSG